jgi:hypothetical protein
MEKIQTGFYACFYRAVINRHDRVSLALLCYVATYRSLRHIQTFPVSSNRPSMNFIHYKHPSQQRQEQIRYSVGYDELPHHLGPTIHF